MTNVRYYSDERPLHGTYSLRVAFQADSHQLSTFLKESGFPPLKGSAQVVTLDREGDCILDNEPYREIFMADGSNGKYVRSVMVDKSAEEWSRIYVSAEEG